jgi:hypothetical protein
MKSDSPGLVVRPTKPTIAFLAAPSFHDGKGSLPAGAAASGG